MMTIRQLMSVLGRLSAEAPINVDHINVDEQGVWIDASPSPYRITAESDYDGSGQKVASIDVGDISKERAAEILADAVVELESNGFKEVTAQSNPKKAKKAGKKLLPDTPKDHVEVSTPAALNEPGPCDL